VAGFIGFLGTYTPRLDEKGRLILPAKFREGLADGLVMAKGQERCVVIYPVAEFAKLAVAVQQAPSSVAGVRDYSRVLASSATDDVLDKQGRVTIPPLLRDYAGLDRELAVIGNFNRVEVWEQGAWAAYLQAKEPGFAEQSQEVAPGLF